MLFFCLLSFLATGTPTAGAAVPSVHRYRQLEARLSAVAHDEDELPGGFGHQSAGRASAEGRHRDGGGRLASTRSPDCREQRRQLPRAIPVHGAGEGQRRQRHNGDGRRSGGNGGGRGGRCCSGGGGRLDGGDHGNGECCKFDVGVERRRREWGFGLGVVPIVLLTNDFFTFYVRNLYIYTYPHIHIYLIHTNRNTFSM